MSEFQKVLEEKKATAIAKTPAGMKFVGWIWEGTIYSRPLANSSAIPVYMFESI